MAYLVHTAHPQFVCLWLSTVGWALTAVTLGLIQWRVWQVADLTFITSGEAWVGLWRVCFYSHTLVTSGFRVMYCQSMALSDSFTPPEVATAQVLTLLGLVVGFCGNAAAVYALRSVYFGPEKPTPIRRAFAVAGTLCLLSAVCFLIPLLWNLNSVVTNQTIAFPSNFHMPPAPVTQNAGAGIGVGIVGSFMMIVSGVIFILYRFPVKMGPRVEPSGPEARHFDGSRVGTLSILCPTDPGDNRSSSQARDNPAFHSDEHL
uniref:claudin-34-like n=1 Tax=Oncorhynchus gorbuscha TaxID=8017 RepID=UPI001EAF2909|nr:claudin-34-like [Oncorhynchus gorbuscha]XP_046175815.1 claudin-34-like [Oncorhynchus gorbuscha]XP_046175816.1 claudin-34-like [Oncorhynchus gorbuscha]